jgi:FkbH-like protein
MPVSSCQTTVADRAVKVAPALATIDCLGLSAGDARKISRELAESAVEPQVRIALGGNVVFEPLLDFLRVFLAREGLTAAFYAIEFGQSMQVILEPNSGLSSFEPHYLFLHFEADELLSVVVQRRQFGSAGARRAAVSELVDRVVAVVEAAIGTTSATVLVSNFVERGFDGLGLADWRSEFGEQEFFASLNSSLALRFRSEPRVQLVNVARLAANFGCSRARDSRLFSLSRIAWHETFLPILADTLCRHIKVSLGGLRKCLVLDLDNTLWAGVLGEDGVQGVRAGIGDSAGEAHYRLQQKILAMKERGVLLAVCSKNNPDDVAELFRVRTDMPLRATDFASMQIGWGTKDRGLAQVAAELSIDTASLVFLDDSRAEIELIRQSMPEVECVLLPADSALIPSCLDRVDGLNRVLLTQEDLNKSDQYQQQSMRALARSEFVDLPAYLRSLETRIEIQPLRQELVARAHQLFSKTNQFNASVRRYSLAEVSSLCGTNDTTLALMVSAADRFGDLGWIAALVLRRECSSTACLENIVVSCRALGRGIEGAILNFVKLLCFEANAIELLNASYRPSRKNSQVREFLGRAGFSARGGTTSAEETFALCRGASTYVPCDWVSVNVRDTGRMWQWPESMRRFEGSKLRFPHIHQEAGEESWCGDTARDDESAGRTGHKMSRGGL